jgi:hypothetical protein
VVTPIAQLPYASYDRAAYEASGGIAEFPLPAGLASDLGSLELAQPIPNDTTVVLGEADLSAESDERCVYVDEGETASATITVFERGQVVQTDVKLLLAQYDSNGNLLSEPLLRVVDEQGGVLGSVAPVTGGKITVGIQSIAPGACYLAFYPFETGPPPAIPKTGIPLPATFYIAVRMLPFDNELEASTPDSQLSWQFIYTLVLRVFSLVYPIMSLVRDLSNRNVVTAMAEQLKFATSLDTFESTLYMPITRDLSAGKRKLLQRWVNLLPNNVPPDPPATGN